MKTHRLKAAWLALPILLLSFGAVAQTIPFEIEFGYRWTDIEGNEDLYRTQINERDGFLIRSFSLFTTDATAAFDHLRINASDVGTGPASAIRLEAGKDRLYNLRLGYREADAFSALPAFANPLLGQGIIPGQHTFDRTRTMLDLDLEILPGRRVVPFVGYSMNNYEGPGTTTYTFGGDDFHLGQDLDESENEFRAGVAFSTRRIQGLFTQGWRSLSSDETLSLLPGAGAGNTPGNVMGRPITATGITRSASTDVDTPFTNFYVTGELTPRVRLIANYNRFAAETDDFESQSAAGSFLSRGIGRFFTGVEETVTGNAKNTTWRGGARAEVNLNRRLDLSAGYRTEARELSGSALINTLFRDTITFGGVDPRDVQQILQTRNSLDRDEDVFHLTLTARAIGPLAVRVGYMQTKQDFDVAPDLAEIVVPGNQGGRFDRKIDTLDASATFRHSGFLLTAAARLDDADTQVVRTDYMNRDRIRLRAAYTTPRNLFTFGVTAEETNLESDRAGNAFDAEVQQITADFEVAPLSMLRLRGGWSQLRSENLTTIRRPETFVIEPVRHLERGDALEAGLSLMFQRYRLDADLTWFENEGSIPFDMNRHRIRFLADFFTHAGITAEWARDKYEEVPAYGQFDADRYGLYLRWRP
jgi:hypothetical protein